VLVRESVLTLGHCSNFRELSFLVDESVEPANSERVNDVAALLQELEIRLPEALKDKQGRYSLAENTKPYEMKHLRKLDLEVASDALFDGLKAPVSSA